MRRRRSGRIAGRARGVDLHDLARREGEGPLSVAQERPLPRSGPSGNFYSGNTVPEPPISFGSSRILGSPSFIGITVSR
jgi:hypothetical protein